ncbi:MAG: hypothetical protein WDO19_11025 [Bacteroidota bacterium]
MMWRSRKYFNPSGSLYFLESITNPKTMRYGENPHQSGVFYGDLNALFDQLNGKELSYNNLVDVDAADAINPGIYAHYICDHQAYECLWCCPTPCYKRKLGCCTCR